jgi:heavy metal translocating P-type ATPase
MQFARAIVAPAAAGAALAAGALWWARGDVRVATWIWLGGLLVTGLPIAWRTLRGMLRGEFAADVVAMLAILAAIGLREPFAGLIVVLMQTGGEALERWAEGKASQAVRDLEAAAPRIAHRRVGEAIEDVPVDALVPGDRLLLRPGELVPCDATVTDGHSDVDVSRLTGEPVPARAVAGVALPQGAVNGAAPLELVATAKASASQYARIVQLVRSAQSSKAPIQRTADRVAVWFTPITLAVCAVAWAMSGDAARVLAVLVVATPCPLILAVPVAIIGGVNRAARRQVIVRHGGALELLADVHVIAFDKTGTLTVGRPRVREVHVVPGASIPDVLRLAGAVEVGSSHLLARTLVEAAHAQVGALPTATEVLETAGHGVEGVVEGHHVMVGAPSFLIDRGVATAEAVRLLVGEAPGLRAAVAVDGVLVAMVSYADEMRRGVPAVMTRLRSLGVRRVVLLSGDHSANAIAMAAQVGIGEALGDLKPEDKVREVRAMVAKGDRVLMVGDGTNDAPALAAASVGIALAGSGGGIATEAADAVILVDDVSRVADAIAIGQRTMRIAKQSVAWGIGLSGVAMLVAAFGGLEPAIGALVQEGIDVAVILNAVRAAGAGWGRRDATGPSSPTADRTPAAA